jgi:hypothetical protein
MRSLLSLPLVFCVVLAGTAPAYAGPADKPAQDEKQWQQIVRSLAKGRKVARERDRDRTVFIITSKRGRASLSAGISFPPIGTFLDKAEYERAYAAASDEERGRTFPAGGKRAMLTSVFFGPGGSSSAIVSTTSDERHDVRIVVADTGATRPSRDEKFFNVFALNRGLHRAYEAQMRGR